MISLQGAGVISGVGTARERLRVLAKMIKPGGQTGPDQTRHRLRGKCMRKEYSVFAGTMADLTYPQVAAAAAGACVLLPTGVIEQHGPHLPLGTDAYGAYQLCRMVEDELDRHRVPALIAPPVFWGINQVSGAFAGTFRGDRERADDVLVPRARRLRRHGPPSADGPRAGGPG
ncbi:creatininase family protein [Streptomyces sp. NPDC090445]|uniref:creatininase family protein n=1 Tax=Streptomyces sp. NPDC090445 TaxID=3365963 RepID=UPI0038151BEB